MSDEAFLSSITLLEKKLVYFYTHDLKILTDARSVLEIGSGWGIFARSCLMANDFVHLTTIDKQINLEWFDKNTQGYESRITRMFGKSQDLLKDFFDESFDVVFVDGDHGYEACLNDLKEAARIVKRGGTIIVDDVYHKSNYKMVNGKGDYGVMQALSEFCLENNIIAAISPVAHGVAVIEPKA